MKWRYSLRWKLPHRPCPGPLELVSVVVEAGQAAPEEEMSCWVAGAGYAVCVDFLDERQIKRWSDKRKAAARHRNLVRRINRIAPLFADELIERELFESRPRVFSRQIRTMMARYLVSLAAGKVYWRWRLRLFAS